MTDKEFKRLSRSADHPQEDVHLSGLIRLTLYFMGGEVHSPLLP